jgi:hypothetical protein
VKVFLRFLAAGAEQPRLAFAERVTDASSSGADIMYVFNVGIRREEMLVVVYEGEAEAGWDRMAVNGELGGGGNRRGKLILEELGDVDRRGRGLVENKCVGRPGSGGGGDDDESGFEDGRGNLPDQVPLGRRKEGMGLDLADPPSLRRSPDPGRGLKH